MQNLVSLFCCLFCTVALFAQPTSESAKPSVSTVATQSLTAGPYAKNDNLSVKKDSLAPGKKQFVAPQKLEEEVADSATIDMYKIYQLGRATQIIDTSLTIQKAYRTNYLRRDYFELLPFVNMGHAYNRLGHDFSVRDLLPQMGAQSKHTAYIKESDIKYYEVPTPITELFFRTSMEQGQLSDAVISFNTSPQFNFAVAYRGMRSLGKYVNERSADEALRFSFVIKSKNDRYQAKVHYLSQTLENQENGGITPESETLFASGDEDFLERSVLDVRMDKAINILKGKRSFLAHSYALVRASNGNQWTIRHEIMNETKRYTYTDQLNSDYFGPMVYQISLNDINRWAILKNRISTTLQNTQLGKLDAGISYSTIDYFFELQEGLPEETAPLHLDVDQSFLDVAYDFRWRGFDFQAFFNKTLTGERLSDEIRFTSALELTPSVALQAKGAFINRSPNLNFVRYRSNYLYYNWYNQELNNEKITHLSAQLSHEKWGSVGFQLQRLENYTYYNQLYPLADAETGEVPDLLLTQVAQTTAPLTYFKAHYRSHYYFGKFALTTTAQYQRTQSDQYTNEDQRISPLHVPEWNIRTTLSFRSDLFNKALYLQAGITGQYFSAYYADAYNPLLGDFMRQDRILVGDYPRVDAFVNARIQRTRIYFTYEHVNSSFTGYDYYSAPSYPYRDRLMRLGIVWNFFD